MTSLDEHARPEPDPGADELGTLTGFLEFQRATFAWRTRGLDADGLSRSVAASTMTLGGMLKHLAMVEEYWFGHFLLGREMGAPFDAADWDQDPDWDWHSAADDAPGQLHELWASAVARARVDLATALERGDVGQRAQRAWDDGRAPSLRWILCHMVEEYARHNGHADLIRESIDGETGE